MNVEARRFPLRTLVVASGIGLVLFAKGCVSKGVPAPPPTLTDSSPVTDFLRYGDSLHFATDSPGVATFVRDTGGVRSTLRVRSELRLPYTDEADYTHGRIIEKFETTGSESPFHTPVGIAYLWVKANPAGGFNGTLFWRNYATGDTGRVQITQTHSSARRVAAKVAECIAEPSTGPSDPDAVCCLCGGWRYNCSATGTLPTSSVDSILNNAGHPTRR